MPEKIKGLIIYLTYKIEQEKARVCLYGRLENGESFLTVNDFTPYFFIRKKDLEKALELNLGFGYEETNLRNFSEEPVVKISVNIPKQVSELREIFEKNSIACYEADIRFPYRFMIDKNIFGAIEIWGEHAKGDFTDRAYDEAGISQLKEDFEFEPKVISIDIETASAIGDFKKTDLYCISIYSEDFEKVLIVSGKKGLKKAECFDNENDLLIRFNELVRELDPDIITGWNVIDFDLKFLEEKFRKYDLPFQLGRSDENCRLKITSDFFRDSTADFQGRIVLDGLYLLKNSFVRLEDYRLDTAAQAILGEKKLIGHENKKEKIDELFRNDPQGLADYNLKDSKLVYDILEKKKIIQLAMERERLTGMPMDRINASIAALDSLYLRELRKRGYVASSSGFARKEKPIKGGFVLSSKPGIYDYVIVCDFKSLYSSVIRTFNIDPLMFVRECGGKNLIKAPNGVCFKKEKGILPDILQRLWVQRDKAKKRKDDVASNALKIVMNSFWGSLASPNCRYFDWDLANSITSFSQHVIKTTISHLQELGYDVIYGDTDSVFVNIDVKSDEDGERIGKNIQDTINVFFQGYIKKEFGQECFLELQFEKLYRRFLMPRIRKGDAGAKKRYAGLLLKDGKEKMDFTGLEFVRRDWTELSKKFQLEVLDLIFHKKEVFSYIKKFVADLKQGKYDELLVYKKAIRKDLDKYTKTTPPHVKAARQLGELKTNIIEYIMTLNGPEPVEKLKSQIDYDHYVEKQIKPIADSILVFYNQSFDEIIRGSRQKGLSDY